MNNLLLFSLHEPFIADAAEREAALDINRSLIVEAPAGSGKTALLIQRFLKLLSSDTVTDPAQVLAVTFTRKATHEMRDRIFKQLDAAARNLPVPDDDLARATRPLALAALARDRALGWNLAGHPDRLNISTIDALCIRIAKALPVMAGVGGLSPVEDASELHAAAARQTLNLLGAEHPNLDEALRILLLHRDGSLSNCEHLIAEMLPWRDQWASLIPLAASELTEQYLDTVSRPKLERALQNAICRALTSLDKVLPTKLCHQLSELTREMAVADGYKGAPNPLAICRELPLHPGTAATSLDHWKVLADLLLKAGGGWRKGLNKNHVGFEITKHHGLRLGKMIGDFSLQPGLLAALSEVADLPSPTYPEEQWLVVKALFRVLGRALEELQLVFQSRGQCDFTEFSLVARHALTSSSAFDDLSGSPGFDLQHLLVDEMQDTSSSQYDIIRLLTQHWDGYSQTVFLVGDPRQSIYLFRQARVERFIATLQSSLLGDLPLTRIHLRSNFRSQGSLVQDFNSTFSLLFPPTGQATPEPLPYFEAFSVRESVPETGIHWHATVVPHSDDKSARFKQIRHNAAEIRALVEAWRKRPLPSERSKPWKIAVLVRERSHLLQIVRAFKQTPPVPFRAVQTEPLAERQEVLDLVALTRALLHPADRTAWFALLRTPWCGLTLRDLHMLAGQDDSSNNRRSVSDLLAERRQLLSADGSARLAAFEVILSNASARRARLTLSQSVQRTWLAVRADAFCTTEQFANATRFFELLDELEARSAPVSISALEARMSRLYAAESTTPDAVDLMTIHRAKGLEWDFVVVPQLESSSGSTRTRLLNWTETDDGNEDDDSLAHGIISPIAPRGDTPNALTNWIRSITSSREAAERKRLFYVASTRAREELHLFASPRQSSSGAIHPRSASLLEAAWPAAERELRRASPKFTSQTRPEPAEVFQIAAALSLVPAAPAPLIQRIPLALLEEASLTSQAADNDDAGSVPAPFTRPQGSFAARALGNATHDFLELLAKRIAAGSSSTQLLAELPAWSPRIASVLRSGGLSHDQAALAAPAILRSLTRTLNDPHGRWLLAPHPHATSERSVTTAAGIIRLDRTFLAGDTPQSNGSTHLWIVDFKTATHGAEGVDAFLTHQRGQYAPQLESYARHLASNTHPVRLALYYPAIPRLLWWPFKSH